MNRNLLIALVVIIAAILVLALYISQTNPQAAGAQNNAGAAGNSAAQGTECGTAQTPEEQDLCIQNLAVKNADQSLCLIATTDFGKDGCYGALALDENSIPLCEKMLDLNRQSGCLNFLIQKGAADYTLCGKMPVESFQNECYNSAAIKTSDKNYCEKITDAALKTDCIGATLTDKEKEWNNCLSITNDTIAHDSCFSMIASQQKDTNVCDQQITDTQGLYSCYGAVAVATHSTAPCDKITDTTMRDGCYTNLAVMTVDANACKKISSPAQMANCNNSLHNLFGK